MTQVTEFADISARLAEMASPGEAALPGGVTVSLVRARGLSLSPGRCSVVPVGVAHHGAPRNGAGAVLFPQPG